MKKKSNGHGGAREGAGRKVGFKLNKSQLKEKTKVKRVPLGVLKAVDELIDRYNKSKNGIDGTPPRQ